MLCLISAEQKAASLHNKQLLLLYLCVVFEVEYSVITGGPWECAGSPCSEVRLDYDLKSPEQGKRTDCKTGEKKKKRVKDDLFI